MATAVSFTGGKDSVLALHLASGFQHSLIPWDPSHTPPVTLAVTFAPPDSDFKAHPLPIIQAQAAALRVPHVVCQVTAPFLDSYQQQLRRLREEFGITHLVTGDMLDVAAGFMEAAAQGASVELVRPLWQCPRRNVLTALHDLQIRCIISCVDLSRFAVTAASPVGDGQQLHSAEMQQLVNGDQQQQQQQQHQQQSVQHTSCGGAEGVTQQQIQWTRHSTPLPAVGQACAAAQSCCSLQPSSQTASPGGFDAERDLLGQELTEQLIAGPLTMAERCFGADLCGERGEYHTLVVSAPLMASALHLVAVGHRKVVGSSHAYVEWAPLASPDTE